MREIGRWQFLGWGLGLALLKYALDLAVARYFGEQFSPSRYWIPMSLGLLRMLDRPLPYAFALASTAVPFVCAGVWLCVLRLRALGWNPVLAFLFFIPAINLIFFLTLVGGDKRPASHPRVFESGKRMTKGLAAIIVGVGGFAASFACAAGFESYGWGLFLALPLAMGVAAEVLVNTAKEPGEGFREPMIALWGAFAICACLFLALALEGLLCLLMAAPLAIVLGFFGVFISHVVRAPSPNRWAKPAMLFLLAASPPLIAGIEKKWPLSAPVYRVDSFVDIDASPEAVWPIVIAFPEIAEPKELLFRAGIAYPIRARIEGSGVGAIRYCEFSTGPFIEPITNWEPAKRLAFSVTHNPEPMRELSFFEIHPPHLRGFMQSQQGEFRLEALEGSRRTRLHGSTWYKHGLSPAGYWRWWSDAIIHRIHGRVLEHIKKQVELTN